MNIIGLGCGPKPSSIYEFQVRMYEKLLSMQDSTKDLKGQTGA